MIPVWPEEFRQKTLVDGFKSGTRGTRLSTPMDVGPPKMRRRGVNLRPISFADYFTADQRARFDRFWEEDLGNGTRPFLYPNPHLNGFTLGDENGNILQDETGNNLVIGSWLLCQFGTADPAWTALGGGYFAPQFEIIALP